MIARIFASEVEPMASLRVRHGPNHCGAAPVVCRVEIVDFLYTILKQGPADLAAARSRREEIAGANR
jgi:hypothetical protein